MRITDLHFKDFCRLCALGHSFVVIFLPKWRQFNHLEKYVPNLETIFQVIVDVNDPAEDYVINVLRVISLPYVAFYTGGLFSHGMEISDDNRSGTAMESFQQFDVPDCARPFLRGRVFKVLFDRNDELTERPIRLYVSGDRSSVGKSSTCLAILAGLVASGVRPCKLAYIKPATQCEAEQPVAKYCRDVGIQSRSIGPVVFYQGFTRAFLAGETPPASVLLESIVKSVEEIEIGKSIVLVDGVGYPSVGSICNVSNGHIASALGAPAVLVGKSGVGDAVDSYNINAVYLESFGVKVLGGIFNKIEIEGFYNLQACKEAVTSYFEQFKPSQMPYGFVPKLEMTERSIVESKDDGGILHWTKIFMNHVDLERLIYDAWNANVSIMIFRWE